MSEMEKALAGDGYYMTVTRGDSMAPMLVTGTRILIKKPVFPLKKYDIPVYRREDHYTMHRIVKVTGKGYVICGDNRIFRERDITEKDIVGVFAGMYRGTDFIRAEDLIGYGRKACRSYPVRRFRWFAEHGIRKIKRILSPRA